MEPDVFSQPTNILVSIDCSLLSQVLTSSGEEDTVEYYTELCHADDYM